MSHLKVLSLVLSNIHWFENCFKQKPSMRKIVACLRSEVSVRIGVQSGVTD